MCGCCLMYIDAYQDTAPYIYNMCVSLTIHLFFCKIFKMPPESWHSITFPCWYAKLGFEPFVVEVVVRIVFHLCALGLEEQSQWEHAYL